MASDGQPELAFAETGSGEPLVILHGLFGSSKNWQSHARRLAGQFRVISVDLRNHGESFHSEEMSYDAMAGDVERLLARLGLEEFNLLGHSMGGKVGMLMACRHPARVARMVVADIAPVAYFHHYDDLLEPILSLPLAQIESRTQADHDLRPHIPEDSLRAFLLQNLVREPEGWRWRVNWRAIQRELENLTGFDMTPEDWSVDIPTLFLRGARSDYVGEAEIEEIRRHFERAEIATIENAGHWLHAEKPEEFARLVSDFLARPRV